MSGLNVVVDALRGAAIADFLTEHVADVAATKPPGHRYACDLAGLRRPDTTVWTAWEDRELVGCVALRTLDAGRGELKSLRTAPGHEHEGIAGTLVEHVLTEAQRRGHARVLLETGTQPFFAPARHLYARHGFRPCAAYGDYPATADTVFLCRDLAVPRSPGCGQENSGKPEAWPRSGNSVSGAERATASRIGPMSTAPTSTAPASTAPAEPGSQAS